MKRTIQLWIAAILFATSLGGATLTLASTQTSYAACNASFLTFPAWYSGLQDSNCAIKAPAAGQAGLSKFIWTIVLNIINFCLQLVGYVSVGFIIFGGFKYITSAGSPDGMVKARKTITNAIVGLLISIFSVAIVSLIAGAIK